MRRYRFLISYPYPLKTIRILSVQTLLTAICIISVIHCSNYQGGQTGDVTPLQLCVPPYCLCSWHPQYFVTGTAGAHVTPTSSSTSTSHVTHVMLTNETDSILIITLVLIKV